MLKLVDKQRTSIMTACETEFVIPEMSIDDKERLVYELTHVSEDKDSFSAVLDIIASKIVAIKGHNEDVRFTLGQMTDITQLRLIVRGIIEHCSLTEDEAKNLPSS